ncbi:glycosyltransferase family 2 protein [Rhizobium tumorigenes]|uniref:glycosyltransferase family 2 protein n=1 Tax=Rhizobium tumorigenes TaxID=2041385 RepID=UPI00241F7FD1|nr:glycosyltransferase family 2 protein [Rhizobium tumorigenes]WFS03323.1 glycosyltransferase family 2 protein [Rhizobium tumorigenes]
MSPVKQSAPPLLSIIITCYNYERYIDECINSALDQDYKSVEVIVVDDGSTDGSWQRIQAYHDRLMAIRTENGGALQCSLNGLKLARGEFVYFLDADDVLCADALGSIAQHLKPENSKIQFMLMPIDSVGNQIGRGFPRLDASGKSGQLIQSIFERGYYDTPPTSGNIYRRDVYDKLGDLSYERAIDGVPYLLAPFLGEVISVDKILGKYRIHNANLSSFSKLSSERMDGYISRFSNRLDHLQQLLHSRGLSSGSEKFRSDYAYVLEMSVLSIVVSGRRPHWTLIRQYLGAVMRENYGKKRAILILFGLSIFVLPDSARRYLAVMRVDPSKASWLRARLRQSFSVSY